MCCYDWGSEYPVGYVDERAFTSRAWRLLLFVTGRLRRQRDLVLDGGRQTRGDGNGKSSKMLVAAEISLPCGRSLATDM